MPLSLNFARLWLRISISSINSSLLSMIIHGFSDRKIDKTGINYSEKQNKKWLENLAISIFILLFLFPIRLVHSLALNAVIAEAVALLGVIVG